MPEHDIAWLECPECGRLYFLASTLNPRNGKWQAIPLEKAPEGVQGNFEVNLDNQQIAKDLAMNDIGPYPVGIYAQGDYVPHNPSHFTGAPPADENLHRQYIENEPYYGRGS